MDMSQIKLFFFLWCRQTVCKFQLNTRDLYVAMVISEKLKPTCQTVDTSLLCQRQIRWSGFYLRLIQSGECPPSTFVFTQTPFGRKDGSGSTVQEVRDTLIDCLCPMWSFFISYLLYQYCGADFLAGNVLGIPEYLSRVDMWKFSAMQMPLPLTDGPARPYPHCWWRDWVSNIQKLPGSFLLSKNATRLEFVDSAESIPQIIKSRKSRISHFWSSCLRDLEAAQIVGRNTPLAHGLWLWEEAGFLKRTFISFIAKLWGLWVCKYAVHSSRFSSNK